MFFRTIQLWVYKIVCKCSDKEARNKNIINNRFYKNFMYDIQESKEYADKRFKNINWWKLISLIMIVNYSHIMI